jgi:hypothetical protein
LTAGAVDALTHAFRSATVGLDLQADLHAATHALEQLVGTIAKAPRWRDDSQIEDRLREEKFLQRLAVDFRVSEAEVRGLVTQLRRKTAFRPAPAAAPGSASVRETIDPLERELLEIVLQFPGTFEQVASVIQPAQFVSHACRAVFSQCAHLQSAGILPDFERLLLEIEDAGVKNLLVELDENGRRKVGADCDVRLQDVLAGFERRQREHWMRGRTAALRERQMPQEDELAVLLELEKQQRDRQQQMEERSRLGISDPTEG